MIIQKKSIAKAKTFEELNRSKEIQDENPEFDTYLFDIETFYNKVTNQWNVKRLNNSQKRELIKVLMKIANYLKNGKG